jgi:hypothetical protein
VDEPLAWLPPTSAALAWRLLSLDAAVRYAIGARSWRETLPAYRYLQLPALTPQRDRIMTLSGAPTYGSAPMMPLVACALLPADPTDFDIDVAQLTGTESDSHLRHQVPSGAPTLPIFPKKSPHPCLPGPERCCVPALTRV